MDGQAEVEDLHVAGGGQEQVLGLEVAMRDPAIVDRGASWYAGTGTEKSPGTKMFSV